MYYTYRYLRYYDMSTKETFHITTYKTHSLAVLQGQSQNLFNV